MAHGGEEMVSQINQRVLALRNIRISFGYVCVVSFAVLSTSSAFAVGNLKMESSGFLRRSVDRDDSVTTLSIGPKASRSGKYLESTLDAQANV